MTIETEIKLALPASTLHEQIKSKAFPRTINSSMILNREDINMPGAIPFAFEFLSSAMSSNRFLMSGK
jgi:hypothetical protein